VANDKPCAALALGFVQEDSLGAGHRGAIHRHAGGDAVLVFLNGVSSAGRQVELPARRN
jgi:hypothetical protein